MALGNLLNILQVVVGFGFVIFWHELGHFLAARWAGVRVEQFSIGMGHAIVSYRKGVGVRLGNTRKQYEAATDTFYAGKDVLPAGFEGKYSEYQRGEAAKQIGMGETEYRIAWIPLGGYVKPTGQDDLRPAAQVNQDDPYAYGAKSPGKRMVIIGAGVVMNVILAFMLYVGLFLSGFNAPPAVVGNVQPGSPAQLAGLGVGDQILELNGKVPHDFTKIPMGVALLEAGSAAPIKIRKPDGTIVDSFITPASTSERIDGLLSIGITPATELRGVDDTEAAQKQLQLLADRSTLFRGDMVALRPGERVSGIAAQPVKRRNVVLNGREVEIDPIEQLDAALQQSNGKPVELTVTGTDGTQRAVRINPQFMSRFNERGFDVAGMMPRTTIDYVEPDSVADKAGLHAGDRVLEIRVDRAVINTPDAASFFTTLQDAQKNKQPVTVLVERDGETLKPIELKHPDSYMKVTVVGIGVSSDFESPVVANTRAANKDIPSMTDTLPLQNVTVASIGGQAVASFYDMNRIVAAVTPDVKVALQTVDAEGVKATREVAFTQADVRRARQNRYVTDVAFKDLTLARKTSNPLEAAAWGFGDTKDSLTSVYRTIHRLVQGSVPVSSLHGPVGIFGFGQTAADRGFDWFIWFMALISANLAVVNFLPVPIVDGGLFIFLLIEKVTGRPPSPKVQSFAQLVGLVLIASVFLFVTYNDLSSKI